MDRKAELAKTETCYLPAHMDGRVIKSELLVSEGTLVHAPAHTTKAVSKVASVNVQEGDRVDSSSHCEENEGEVSVGDFLRVAEEEEMREREGDTLGVEVENSSLLDEEVGEPLEVGTE